jgi:hypothetical protein
MMRATLVSLALLVGGGSVAFAEDPMPAEQQTAPKAAEPAKAEDAAPKAETGGKKHHKNKARNKKPSAKKHHKHHAKKAK